MRTVLIATSLVLLASLVAVPAAADPVPDIVCIPEDPVCMCLSAGVSLGCVDRVVGECRIGQYWYC